MGFDKKRFGNHEKGSKQIESIDDILFTNICRQRCTGVDCGECGMKLYGGCIAYDNKVVEWLEKESGLDKDYLERITKGKRGLDAQEEAYKAIFEDPLWTSPVFAKKQAVGRCDGTCSTCRYSQIHSSGICFCKSFGNFVHDDGYCYRHEEEVSEDV